jgi:hypothetical protein
MAINASTSYAAVGNYTEAWKSIYSIYFPPEIWNEWFERYGGGFKVLDFLNMAKRSSTVANRTFHHYEDGTDQRVATVRTQIPTGIAGATFSMQCALTDYDSGGNGPLREHFTVLVPAAYQPAAITTPRAYVVTTITGTGNAQTFTCSPLSTDSQISVAIPANTELAIGSSVFAPGTGQPDGMSIGTYRRTHYTQIVKESAGFEGGQIAHRNYREVVDKAGNPGLFDRGMVETEFRLDRQIDSALFVGEANANSLVQTSNFGGTPNRQGTQGLWNWQAALAQTKNYTGDFDMDDFDDIKPLLQSQGVNGATVWFGYGTNLGLSVENGVLDALKEWSGGSNLLESSEYFKVDFKKVMKNGVKFACQELISFANPNYLGNDSYTFQDDGFMMPVTDVSVTDGNGMKQVVPNLSVAYLNHAGEDRTRIIGTVAGLNGMGYDIKNEYDGSHIYMLSELALFAANVNQHIQIIKS